jgi:mono/diheme cytochrome c family protein
MFAGQENTRLPWKRLALLILCLLPACQQQMARQPSYRPDEPSSFFPDGRADRPLVSGTVARGHLRTDAHLYRGSHFSEASGPADALAQIGAAAASPWSLAAMAATQSSDEAHAAVQFPFPITEPVLRHGQNRYMIYCVVCHDSLGTGHGIVVQRGYTAPPSFHQERLRQVPVGHIFQVITKGYGSMPSYGKQVPPRDRWAIAAYVRALQSSQHFFPQELPADLRRQWVADEASARRAEGVGGNP